MKLIIRFSNFSYNNYLNTSIWTIFEIYSKFINPFLSSQNLEKKDSIFNFPLNPYIFTFEWHIFAFVDIILFLVIRISYILKTKIQKFYYLSTDQGGVVFGGVYT